MTSDLSFINKLGKFPKFSNFLSVFTNIENGKHNEEKCDENDFEEIIAKVRAQSRKNQFFE